ncbi:hypothetical protein [Vibrio sp. R78045]|uniref:hypothetical protein n=1 Tax=Vibrio sp. R78045 TaxID=3093868 RepID=UPI0036F2B898
MTEQSTPLSPIQESIKRRLILSCVNHGTYTPSDNVKTSLHCALLLDGKPLLLTGYSDCNESINQANQLKESQEFNKMLTQVGLNGELSIDTVNGAELDWKPVHKCLVKSKSGTFEEATGKSELIAILVGEHYQKLISLSGMMCVSTETAQILEPNTPDLNP